MINKRIYQCCIAFLKRGYGKIFIEDFVFEFLEGSEFDKYRQICIAGSYLLRDIYGFEYNDIDIFVSEFDPGTPVSRSLIENEEYWGDQFQGEDKEYLTNGALFLDPYSSIGGVITVERKNKFNIIHCFDVEYSLSAFDFSPLMVFYNVKKKQMIYKSPACHSAHYNPSVITTIIGCLGHIGMVFQDLEPDSGPGDGEVNEYFSLRVDNPTRLLLLYFLLLMDDTSQSSIMIKRLITRYEKYKSREFSFPFHPKIIIAVIILYFPKIFLEVEIDFSNTVFLEARISPILEDLPQSQILRRAELFCQVGDQIQSDISLDTITAWNFPEGRIEAFDQFVGACNEAMKKYHENSSESFERLCCHHD